MHHFLLSYWEAHPPQDWREWSARYSPSFFHRHMLVIDLRQGHLPRRWNVLIPQESQ